VIKHTLTWRHGVALLVALGLAACGGSDPSGTTATGPSAGGSGPSGQAATEAIPDVAGGTTAPPDVVVRDALDDDGPAPSEAVAQDAPSAPTASQASGTGRGQPAAAAVSAEMSFQRGVSPSASYAGVADTWLQQAVPSANAGADTALTTDRDAPAGSGQRATTLLRFDLSAIPRGAKVQAAELSFTVTNRTSGEPFVLYAARRAWNESQATWNQAAASTPWEAPGARGAGDRGSTVLGQLLPTATGRYAVSLNAAGVAVVQGWVNAPQTNHGFVLDAITNMDGMVLASSEAADPAQRPRLSVKYEPAFVHPGLHVSAAQLDFVRARIAAGAQPWSIEFSRAQRKGHGNPNWVPRPVAHMRCGNGGSKVDEGCYDARQDALAAYTLALLWYHTRDQRYADGAIRILDAYADTLQSIAFVYGDYDTHNGPLQAAWLAELFPRSAEILRHSNSGWPQERAVRFGEMLRRVMLPRIVDGWTSGGSNWNNSMTNGVMNIAVYTDDRALFEKALGMWRQRVRETIYLASDGAEPVPAPNQRGADGRWKSGSLAKAWWGQTEFSSRTNGISQEVCRDFGHATMSIASLSQAAETALLQGVDLYAEEAARLIAGAEFMAKYLAAHAPASNGKATVGVDPWLCARRSEFVNKDKQPVPNNTIEVQILPTWEILYNHYVNRRGRAMPATAALLPKVRAGGSTTDLQMSWETLTHAGVGAVGL